MPPHSPTSPRSPRKPLPQPVEEIKRTNRASSSNDPSSDTTAKKAHRSLPQPIESSTEHSTNSTRHHTSHAAAQNTPALTSAPPQPVDPSSPAQKQKPRRFAPQMIETSRRRRKSTDSTSPSLTPSDKNDVAPADQDHLPKHMRQARPSAVPVPPDNSPVVSSDHVPQAPESNFSSSKLAEKQERKHSFRVPDLPVIPSQSGTESNDSSLPSLSTSPSPESDETEQGAKKKRKNQARRDSQDAQWSGYLLSLAAKTAEKQLREQVMAAYPNEHAHEPVDHYAIDRDSFEDDGVETGVGKLSVDGPAEEVADPSPAGHHRHRDSATGFDLAEMRHHWEKLEQQRKDSSNVNSSELGRRRSTRKAMKEAEDAYKDAEVAATPSKNIIGWQKENEMKPMQKAASPPMAGQNLQFPKCQSPQATRLDVHQYPGVKKSDGAVTRQHTGLWTPGGGASRKSTVSGLWNGVCNISHQEVVIPPKIIQTGLLTPTRERSDPLSSSKNHSQRQLPPSPPNSQEETSHLDGILRREQSIEHELNDNFVTQVYNYLSLGYPSLARKFDLELSKITRVSIEDLRKDDDRCNAKGYVGAPEGTGTDPRGVMEGDRKCERWCALRQYVREWARQQPEMGPTEELEGGWGAVGRKGSWAI